MTRTYDVRTVALTVGTSAKWIDNLLSHHRLPGVVQGRQGVERRVSQLGIVAIEIVRVLTHDGGIVLGTAVRLAHAALASGDQHRNGVPVGPNITLHVDVPAIERRLHERIVLAVEAAPRVVRGRPRRLT